MNLFKSLWRRPALKREIDEELRFHVEQRTAENVAVGMTPEEAAREARKRFGNAQTIREECRSVRSASFGEATLRDVRHAVRQLRKSPGFTTIAVLSLGLGIGSGTAVFSLVNAILLRSLPVPNPQELRVLTWSGADTKIPSLSGNTTDTGNRRTSDAVNHPLFLSVREQVAPLADVFGFCTVQEVVARAQQDSFVANGLMVSDNFFPALGVRPFMGRLFRPGDDTPSAGPNVVITHHFWESRLASDPGVLGRTILLNSNVFTVIGILPSEFPGVSPGDPPEFYVPMQSGSPFLFTDLTATRHWFVRMMARLNPGTSDAQFQSALNVAFAREANSFMNGPAMMVEPGRSGPAFDRKNYKTPLVLMATVVGLIILIACANLAGLSLARGAAREHELAVRVALGSGRWRLVRQSLTESLVLASLGGGLGLMLALWGKTAIARLLAGSAGGLRYDLSLNLGALGFSFGAALITALLSGLLPAWRASRVDPLDGLKARGTLAAPKLRMGKILVAAQICLSLLLLTGAGLYLRSLANLRDISAGFATEKLLLFELNPTAVGYKDAQLTAFYARTQDALTTIPGVRGATILQYPLLRDRSWGIGFKLPGHPDQGSGYLETHRLTVGESFFSTMGIPILAGRGFSVTDIQGAPQSLVVNNMFARKYFPNEDPLGQTVNIFGDDWRIVGVCGDTKYENIKQPVPPTVYTSFRQYGIRVSACFAVRTALPPMALATAVREIVATIDPNVPVAHLTTQDELRDANISQERLLATLCGALAVLALLLSCIGLYGLMAYHVARRRGEIAIRMALGAQRYNVAQSILREAFLLAVVGIVFGLPGVFALTRFIKSQLYAVQPNDPVTLGFVIVLLVTVTLLAAWLPARRAAKVDPMTALRHE